MTVKSKASKPNTSGVTLNTSGDQFAISLKIGTPGVVDPAKQVIFGTVDTTLPSSLLRRHSLTRKIKLRDMSSE